jgi:hypothetical protein
MSAKIHLVLSSLCSPVGFLTTIFDSEWKRKADASHLYSEIALIVLSLTAETEVGMAGISGGSKSEMDEGSRISGVYLHNYRKKIGKGTEEGMRVDLPQMGT